MNFKIFNAIKDDEELKVNEKYFYCLIINYSNEKGYAYPSYEQLMKDMNTTNRTTISSIIKRLVEKGYIEYVKGNSVKNANRYYPLKYIASSENITSDDNATSNEIVTSNESVTSNGIVTGTSSESVTSTSNKTVTINKKKKKKEKKNIIEIPVIDLLIDKLKIEMVRITIEQYNSLVADFGTNVADGKILALDNHLLKGKGKEYKDHNRVIRTWIRNEGIKPKEVQGNNGFINIPKGHQYDVLN